MSKPKYGFHVVRWAVNDKHHTYVIYHENEVYLIPAAGRKLGRMEAYTIARLLNHLPGAKAR